LKEFVRGFIKAGNAADPAVEISYYADEVDYFGNVKVAMAFIIDDIKKYDQRWPRRAYHLSGEPEITAADSQSDIAKAVFKFQFRVGNLQKPAWESGEEVLLIRNASTNPKVIPVKPKIVSRHEELSGSRSG